MELFDSHTHLNDKPFAGATERYLKQARDLGVTKMAIVGSDRTLNQGALDLAAKYPELSAIVGWHPEFVQDYNQTIEAELVQQLQRPEVVALGEIGLDYHWDKDHHPAQQKLFQHQIEMAQTYDLPISVHSRDALGDTYRILKASHVERTGGIMHSFNGTPEWAAKFLDLGMMISFSGVVSFKNAPDVHAAAKVIPADRLLVETDAPYLAPEPYRGKQNEPGYTRYVAEAVAKLRDVPVEEIAAATFANAKRIFKVK